MNADVKYLIIFNINQTSSIFLKKLRKIKTLKMKINIIKYKNIVQKFILLKNKNI